MSGARRRQTYRDHAPCQSCHPALASHGVAGAPVRVAEESEARVSLAAVRSDDLTVRLANGPQRRLISSEDSGPLPHRSDTPKARAWPKKGADQPLLVRAFRFFCDSFETVSAAKLRRYQLRDCWRTASIAISIFTSSPSIMPPPSTARFHFTP